MVEKGNDKHIEYLFQHTMADPMLDSDVYVFQQRLEKFAPELAKLVLNRGRLFVCDADDYYEGAPFYNTGKRGVSANPDMDVKVLKEQRRMADVVTVSTPFLANAYERDNKNIHVLRNMLDWRMWEEVTPAYEIERERIRVGWIGAAAWRGGDLGELEKWFPEWIARHPEVDFVAAGTNSEVVHEGLRVPRAQRITLPYVAFRTRAHPILVSQMDIGLVPLKRNDFNEAKSHLKGMEYNASGIPCISPPTESYRYWTEHGENGFLAKKPEEWCNYLDQLVADHDLRREMGRKARLRASEHTVQEHWQLWERAWLSREREPDVAQVARTSVSYGALQKWPEFKHLLDIAKDAKVIVEIGSAAGGTMWAFCKVAPLDATVISIDLPGGVHGGHLSDQFTDRRARSYIRGEQKVHLIRGDSHSEDTKRALEQVLDGREVDLLFIDGDHTYEGVKQDWEMYSPLAKVVAFHDIVTHKAVLNCHVDQLWGEIKETDFLGTEGAVRASNRYRFAEFRDEQIVTDEEGNHDWAGIGVVFREASLREFQAA